MNKYLEVLKPKQWLKNLVIFFPMFLLLSFSIDIFVKLVIGFVALCISSSIGYILNDISNIDEDRMNPYKKNRVFASGRLSTRTGKIMMWFLSLGLIVMFAVNPIVSIIGLFLALIDSLYCAVFRDKQILDVITVSSKYPIRYILGGFLVGTFFIEWCVPLFFIAVILATMKRKGELITFKDKAELQRATLKKYTVKTLNRITLVSIIGLMMSLVFVLTLYDMTLVYFPMFWSIVAITLFYEKVDYERSKSLAILKDFKTMFPVILFGIVFMLSLYGVVP